jgi:hypothetical protein
MTYSWEGTYFEEPSWQGDPEGLCISHSLIEEKDKNTFLTRSYEADSAETVGIMV